MKNLKELINNCGFPENKFKIDIINYILENNEFLTELCLKLNAFYNANNKQIEKQDEFENKYNISSLDISKYSLSLLIQEFADKTYKELNHINKNYLF